MSDKEVYDLAQQMAQIQEHLKSQDKVLAKVELAVVGDNNGNRGLVRRFDELEGRMRHSEEGAADGRKKAEASRKKMTGRVWTILIVLLGAILTGLAGKIFKP